MRKLFVGLLAIAGLLAAGCIIQFATLYKDDAGRTHFVGLASNLTNADVVDAVVEIRFYDNSNNLLDTRFVNPCTRTLQDHQSSPVESILPPGVTANRTESIVHPLTFGAKLVPDFDVTGVTLEVDGDITHLKGTVENEDNISFYAVQVGAFSRRDNAEALAEKLKSKGYAAQSVSERARAGSVILYRVRVGRYKSRAEAESQARMLASKEDMPGMVVEVGQ